MPYYILGLYMKTFWGSLVVENSAGGIRCEVRLLCTRKENPGERALVALSPTLESLVLILYCNQSKQPPIIPAV
jgi:hypothetical protein